MHRSLIYSYYYGQQGGALPADTVRYYDNDVASDGVKYYDDDVASSYVQYQTI